MKARPSLDKRRREQQRQERKADKAARRRERQLSAEEAPESLDPPQEPMPAPAVGGGLSPSVRARFPPLVSGDTARPPSSDDQRQSKG